MKVCKVCAKKLNESQWRLGRSYKSCPKCSEANGSEHVFYEYPDNFGTTIHRVTSNNPDGAQSWCYKCRGRGHNFEQKLCSELNGE